MARPRKDPKDKYRTPARQAGRITDGDWAMIKRATCITGCSLREVLLHWAKRVIKEHDRK